MNRFKANKLVKAFSTALFLLLSTSVFSQESLLPCDEVEQEVLEETALDEVALVTAYKPAVAIDRVWPKYPPKAVRAGAEGWVRMSYVVDVNGKVQDPEVQDFGGDKDFKLLIERAAQHIADIENGTID